jgi:hypothetical protein
MEKNQPVYITHGSRLFHGKVLGPGEHKYEVRVRTDQGEEITVHKDNVKLDEEGARA